MKAVHFLAISLLSWQAKVGFSQVKERNDKYALAWHIAREAGKPMLVVGGPYGTNPLRGLFNMKAHGCGDVCLDIEPRACTGCESVVADVRDIPFPDGFFKTALASHVIEHLPAIDDAVQAINELYRVADEVFIASPSKQSILAWLIPSHHLWVRQDNEGIWLESWPGEKDDH
ncbi:MAG TPA: methyltransferase domain-containing protein [Dehalococcoidia bacterium]|nr:methyltransferase domain-containing protein [Dehalococcoidia bacterium]